MSFQLSEACYSRDKMSVRRGLSLTNFLLFVSVGSNEIVNDPDVFGTLATNSPEVFSTLGADPGKSTRNIS